MSSLRTTSNPAFTRISAQSFDFTGAGSMTVQGTCLKAMVLLAILMVTAAFSWTESAKGNFAPGMFFGSVVAGLILFFITLFRPSAAPWSGPLYAACEGVLLGVFSRYAELRFPGVAIQAVALSGGVTFLMLFFYVTGMIRVTGQLYTAVMAATGAVALLYFVSFVMSFFGGHIPYIHESGKIGIAFSVFVVGLAAFNLLLDFDFIDHGAQSGRLPKYMEWYGAWGLMVTLIWLYVEVLNLLMKINRR